MRKNFGPQCWLYPMPVLMIGTYDENGLPNVMNAAWGGIHDTNEIAVCIAPEHKTAKNLLRTKAFTVSIGDASCVAACDYVGLVSGNEVSDKVAKAGFHARKAGFVNAPLFDELPMALECRLLSCDETSGCVTGEIVNVSADEKIIGADGKISPAAWEPLVFDPVHHRYLKLGEAVAPAFKIGLSLKK